MSCLQSNDFDGAQNAAKDLYFIDDKEIYDLFYQYAPEPTACPDCGEPVPWEVNQIYKFFQYKCQNCNRIHFKAEKDKRFSEIQRWAGVPNHYRDGDLFDFPDSFQKLDLSRSIYIHGSVGTGKTRLLVAIFKKYVFDMEPKSYMPEEKNNRHPVISDFTYPDPFGHVCDFPVFIGVPELLLKIKSTFNRKDASTEEDIIKNYSEIPVLFLDDLGAEYSTEWATSTLFLLIDNRYNENLLTFISSNLDLNELGKKLNDRIVSRITEMCQIVKMTGADRRLKGQSLRAA